MNPVAPIIFTIPLVITAGMFIAVSQPNCEMPREFFAVLTAVLTFIGGYAAAEKKNKFDAPKPSTVEDENPRKGK